MSTGIAGLDALLKTVELYSDGDEWGNIMGWSFALCDVLTDVGVPVPTKWEFRQSPMGSDSDDDRYLELSTTLHNGGISRNQLLILGYILVDRADTMRANGEDY